MRITSPARTVVDLFRFSASRYHTGAALTTALNEGVTGDELLSLADCFGVLGEIEPRLEAYFSAISNPRMS
ncbi:hypothetical protein [Microvirga sp. G4-2]|uniref:hypothetical protein n=1 Tax=Microvirga sp. G4-2 TaxID=3434467 RepID=UPI004043D458